MEILYKYKQPELNYELNIVPNQKGKLCKYKDLYNDNEINPKFKLMLKKYFHSDLSNILVHKKLKFNNIKELSINPDIIKNIKRGFYEKLDEKDYKIQYENYLEKAKQLLHFYPKNEDDNKKDNLIKQFINCYKVISGEEIEDEEINTIDTSIWDKAIKILLIDLLQKINEDRNIFTTLTRLKINKENEDIVIESLNIP